MSKYIDGTRVVYFDDSAGNLTIPGTLTVGVLNASTTTVVNDVFGSIGNNFVHYDSANQKLVYNQIGGGGGGGGSSVINASTVTTILDVVASGHLLGQETSQIVDYDFTTFGTVWTPGAAAGTLYYGCAISATGKYQLVTVDSTTVFLSSDYGRTFAPITTLVSVNALIPAISAAGQIMYVGNNVPGASLYKSADYGATWTQLTPVGQWTGVACSADGRYVVPSAIGAQPYLSSDFGVTWTSLPLGVGNWVFSVSATGQYILGTATDSATPLYVSSNFGATWNTVGFSLNYQSCAVSGNGQCMLASANPGAIATLYVSSDYGMTWVANAYTVPGTYFSQLSLSFSGQYQVVSASGGSLAYSSTFGGTFTAASIGGNNFNAAAISANGQYMVTGDTSGTLYTSSVPTLFPAGSSGAITAPSLTTQSITTNSLIALSSIVAPASLYAQELYTEPFVTSQFGQTWTPTATSRLWQGIAVSASGQYQIGGGDTIWTSNDFGATWTAYGSAVNWPRAAISASGQFQAACAYNGQIWISSNYGTSFAAVDSVRLWNAIGLSASGQYVTAGVNIGFLYRSSDYGKTFTQVGPSASFVSVSMSASGQYQTAAPGAGETLWRSTDYGVTWTATATALYWGGVAVSATGQYQTATANGGQIWISSDYGATFAAVASTQGWAGVTISATGQYQAAAIPLGQIWISSDYGTNWTAVATSKNWIGISMSASAQYISACAFGYPPPTDGHIWLCRAPTLFQGASVTGGTFTTAAYDTGVSTNATIVVSAGGFMTAGNRATLSFQTEGGGGATVVQQIQSRYAAPAYGLSFDDIQNNKRDNLRIANGLVGINCNAPAYALDVNGLAHQSTNTTSWYVASDRRIKTDIASADLVSCMTSLQSLPLRQYRYDKTLFPGRQEDPVLGLIAQEVRPLFPSAVTQMSNYGFSDLLVLDYDPIFKTHLGATQYLGSVVETQSTQIAALTAQVSTLTHSLSYIQSTFTS